MGAADVLRMLLFPGDVSYSTVTDMPVDISPRYVVDENIIPFRSVRKPELTPIRAVDAVLRTPFKSWLPVRGRARNIPELPGQQGTRLWPLGSDADMKRTGFSGVVPTMNRTFEGFSYSDVPDMPPSIIPPPETSRIMRCVTSSYAPKTCYSCCESSFPKRPIKRIRCKKKCDTKFVGQLPGPTPVPQPSLSGMGHNPGYIMNDPYALVPAYTNAISGRKNTFGFSPGWRAQQSGVPEPSKTLMPTDEYVEAFACDSWFEKKDEQNNCNPDVLKIGLIAAAVLMVAMK